jgi:hypothetical protein
MGTVRTCMGSIEAASDASLMAWMVFELVWNAIVARSRVLSRFWLREGKREGSKGREGKRGQDRGVGRGREIKGGE